MCFRTEDLFAKPMPQLGHFVEDMSRKVEMNKFPTVLSFNFHSLSFMASVDVENLKSLLPLIEQMNQLLPVWIYSYPPSNCTQR